MSEDNLRDRIRCATRAAEDARVKESEARSALAACVKARREAEQAIQRLIKAECEELPLFDRMPSFEETLAAEAEADAEEQAEPKTHYCDVCGATGAVPVPDATGGELCPRCASAVHLGVVSISREDGEEAAFDLYRLAQDRYVGAGIASIFGDWAEEYKSEYWPLDVDIERAVAERFPALKLCFSGWEVNLTSDRVVIDFFRPAPQPEPKKKRKPVKQWEPKPVGPLPEPQSEPGILDALGLPPPKSEAELLREALHDALHSSADAGHRWDNLKRLGQSDGELKQHISAEFLIGAKTESHRYHVEGSPPRFWLGKRQGRATLSGPKLIAKVREVMGIPQRKGPPWEGTPAPKAAPIPRPEPQPSAEDLASDAELLAPTPARTPLSLLGLPRIVITHLERAGVATVEQLHELGQGERSLVDELQRIKGIDEAMAHKIAERLQDAIASGWGDPTREG